MTDRQAGMQKKRNTYRQTDRKTGRQWDEETYI